MRVERSFPGIALSVAVFIAAASCLTFASGARAATFVDDFQDGSLDGWVIDGRQIAGSTNVANVVACDTGLCAHLYHDKFTEIAMHRDFDFDLAGVLSLDVKVSVYSQPPPAPNYYGIAEVWFEFLDATGTSLGWVSYGAATTDFPFQNLPSTASRNAIPEDVTQHVEVSVAELLAEVGLSDSGIAKIRIGAHTYSSTWPYPFVSAELWLDNVTLATDGLSRITGTVERDGVPLAGEKVRLVRRGARTRTTLTDSTGRYVFDSLDSGDYTINVRKVRVP